VVVAAVQAIQIQLAVRAAAVQEHRAATVCQHLKWLVRAERPILEVVAAVLVTILLAL
jgi:hypothetical protein